MAKPLNFYLDPSGKKTNTSVKKVIAVLSGKGGVGKSTTAALLASGLRRKGLQVGVLDADVTGASIPKLFGVSGSVFQDEQGRIIPPESASGIKVISINLLLQNEDDAVIWRGPLVTKIIKQFWEDVKWDKLDVLVVDMPPGTSDAAITVMQSLPLSGLVIVTTPQDLADMVVRKAANMALQLKIPIVGIVENMSYAICPHCGEHLEIFGKGHGEQLARKYNTQLLGRVSIDPELSRLCDAGQVESYASRDFEPIVEKLQHWLES